MRIVIGDKSYDGSLQPFIGDIRLLKREFGFGYGTVIERMQKLDTKADMVKMFDDDDFLDALVAYIWMVRLRAGERSLTRADVESTVSLDNFRMEDDDTDARKGAGSPSPPEAPPGSGRGDVDEPVASKPPKRSSTRTSKQPSTSG